MTTTRTENTMTTKTDLTAALRKVLDEHDHGALGGRLLEEALADAALTTLSAPADSDLIAEARKHLHYPGSPVDSWCMHCADEWPCVTRRLADALEAAPVVDEVKLAEVIETARRRWDGSGRHEPISTALTRAVVEHLRGER